MKSLWVVAAMLYSIVVLAQPKAYTVGPIDDFKSNTKTGPMATWLDTTLKPILDSLHLKYYFGNPPGWANFVLFDTKGKIVADTMFANINKNVTASMAIIADTIRLNISNSGRTEADGFSSSKSCTPQTNFTDVEITIPAPYTHINATITVPQWPKYLCYTYTNSKTPPIEWGTTTLPIATQTLRFDTFPPPDTTIRQPAERFSIRGKYTFTTVPFYHFQKGRKRKLVVINGTYYFTVINRFIYNPAAPEDEPLEIEKEK